MKRMGYLIGFVLVTSVFVVWVWLIPISSNFGNYVVWKVSSNAKVITGDIENRGAHVRYVAYGQGDPVLLLHGGLSNKLSWFSQIPWLVQSGRRVILIDTRGHGESTSGDAALTYQLFAQDTLMVLDRLHIQRTDIVGWSDGGIIGLLLGLEAPQRVGKLVAISANFHPSGLIQDAENTQNDPLSQPQHKIIDWARSVWSGAGKNHPALEAEINALWRTAPQLNYADLKAITAPTLVIAGENDIIDLPHSGELAQMLANGKIDIVLGAGHAAPVTHARQVNALIASFLDITP